MIKCPVGQCCDPSGLFWFLGGGVCKGNTDRNISSTCVLKTQVSGVWQLLLSCSSTGVQRGPALGVRLQKSVFFFSPLRPLSNLVWPLPTETLLCRCQEEPSVVRTPGGPRLILARASPPPGCAGGRRPRPCSRCRIHKETERVRLPYRFDFRCPSFRAVWWSRRWRTTPRCPASGCSWKPPVGTRLWKTRASPTCCAWLQTW